MARMLSLALLLTLLTLPRPLAYAAEEFTDTIPADLARLLMDFGGQGDFAVYDGIMEGFPAFDLPAGFDVVGGLRQTGTLRIALRTDLDEDSAVARIVEPFTGNGWVEMPQFETRDPNTGFISANDPRVRRRPSVQLCHDELGNLSVSYADRDNQAYVMLTGSSQYSPFSNGIRTCVEQIAQVEQSMAMSTLRGSRGLAQYMPRMELPAPDANAGRLIQRVGGYSGSNQEMETEASIRIDWDMEAVYTHLADQIVAQGWVLDSNSVGAVSATGTWVNRTVGPETYLGTLTIVAIGDDGYDLKFVIRTQGSSSSNGAFFLPGG